MNARFLKLLQTALAAMDIISLNIAVVQCRILFGDRIPDNFKDHYVQLWAVANAAWIIITVVGSLYKEQYIKSFEVFSRRTMHVFAYFMAVMMVYLFFTRQLEISRWFLVGSFASIGLFLLMNRFCYLAVYQYARRKRYLVKRILILGYNETGKRLANYLEEEMIDVEIVGFCEEQDNIHELSHYPILGNIGETLLVSEQHHVNEIYSTIAPEHDLGIYHLMREADNACIGFKLVPDLSFFIQRNVHIDYLKDMPMLSVRKEPLHDVGNRARKRAMDIFISFLVIVLLLSWLVPLIALLIVMESKGPYFSNRHGREETGKFFSATNFEA